MARKDMLKKKKKVIKIEKRLDNLAECSSKCTKNKKECFSFEWNEAKGECQLNKKVDTFDGAKDGWFLCVKELSRKKGARDGGDPVPTVEEGAKCKEDVVEVRSSGEKSEELIIGSCHEGHICAKFTQPAKLENPSHGADIYKYRCHKAVKKKSGCSAECSNVDGEVNCPFCGSGGRCVEDKCVPIIRVEGDFCSDDSDCGDSVTTGLNCVVDLEEKIVCKHRQNMCDPKCGEKEKCREDPHLADAVRYKCLDQIKEHDSCVMSYECEGDFVCQKPVRYRSYGWWGNTCQNPSALEVIAAATEAKVEEKLVVEVNTNKEIVEIAEKREKAIEHMKDSQVFVSVAEENLAKEEETPLDASLIMKGTRNSDVEAQEASIVNVLERGGLDDKFTVTIALSGPGPASQLSRRLLQGNNDAIPGFLIVFKSLNKEKIEKIKEKIEKIAEQLGVEFSDVITQEAEGVKKAREELRVAKRNLKVAEDALAKIETQIAEKKETLAKLKEEIVAFQEKATEAKKACEDYNNKLKAKLAASKDSKAGLATKVLWGFIGTTAAVAIGVAVYYLFSLL